MKNFRILFFLVLFLVISASCGSYKRNSTATYSQQELKGWYQNEKNLKLSETIETLTETSGDTLSGTFLIPKKLSKEPLQFHVNSQGAKLDISLSDDKLDYNLTNKKKQSTATKRTNKAIDTGKVENKTEATAALKTATKTKENPWQPPWWVSGLIVLVLLVVYKIFKAKYQIIKI